MLAVASPANAPKDRREVLIAGAGISNCKAVELDQSLNIVS
jgi:hypothetical protein